VVGAAGDPPRGDDPDRHATAALGAEPGRVELTSAPGALAEWFAAGGAMDGDGHTAETALSVGIRWRR
jgi:hypothetical protein